MNEEDTSFGGEAEPVIHSLLSHPYTRSVAIRFLLLNYRDELVNADREWQKRIEGIINHTWRPWYTHNIPPPEEIIESDKTRPSACYPKKTGVQALSKLEKIVLIALIKKPEASIESIARDLGTCSSRICYLRKMAFFKLNLPIYTGNTPIKTQVNKENREILLSNYKMAESILRDAGILDD